MLNTETPHPRHAGLDLYPPLQLVDAFIEDQMLAAQAVRAAGPQLAAAVEAAAPRLADGGRLIYAGAGTSGRLGLLDSLELWPTFSWPRERAIALLAGGNAALLAPDEEREDDQAQGARDLLAVKPLAKDVVVGLAASGTTPYVLGVLEAAGRAGALTIGVANNPGSPVAAAAGIGITLDTGSEVISGSTRLKAGTAQKIFLNTLSSALMVRLRKVYGNLMVDVLPTNAKLHRRAVALTARATGAEEQAARAALESCHYRVKVAIVMILRKLDAPAAEARLALTQGDVRAAVTDPLPSSPLCP
ncbi:MAG TPA: N-acetylmuramic acid 6-phosphate etherase [Lacunisphaera sp.]|nr:N-acetylmuramic acid 6-phosphate etherase [Lacunisphaera sp.]